MKTIEINVILTDSQAWEFSKFMKRISFSDYRNNATSNEAAYEMVAAGERIREALAQQGYSPR